MYDSPLRDGGYDIADYRAVHPDYGTMDDAAACIEAAHERGMRVIADLVMNHTSSDHPWFQRARTAPPGSPERDWYVWSDTDERYAGARIIFTDTEVSNWTWDPVAGAYYWHRFFSHQPDLNFDNPAVREAMLDNLRHWLDAGLDGFRLDAVPYLFEREGTNCENLPETHAFLKEVRATVDREYPDRVLLAEANQWPEDVVEYFGDGDECHMAFHFPVMPRMFMAIRREEATPIYEILERTPDIPEQLPVGPVPAQPRRADARDGHRRGARLHVHRVRQGPADEDQRRHPPPAGAAARQRARRDGADARDPVLAAGLAGPLLRRRDRDGRQRLPRRPRRRPHADAVDAATATAASRAPTSPSSTRRRRWTRSTATRRSTSRPRCARRRRCCAGCGASSRCARSTRSSAWATYEPLEPSNPKIFAHVRRYEDDVVLCVHNLARSAQFVELDLRAWEGRYPEEMLGRTRFPRIGELPYLLTLAPRGFYWFILRRGRC